jgi:hypothetical protein
MQAPWYYQATQATLKHQRIQEDKLKMYEDRNTWYKKGLKEVRPVAALCELKLMNRNYSVPS